MTDRAVSSNLGLVLLLALTIVGAGVVVGIGGTAFDDIRHQTSVDRAEHAITLLDARTAVVGLGEGSTQTVRLGRTTSGDYAAESDTGWLKITHTNYTAGETETVYNESLGSVSYRTGGTTVAYQGGGVWRHQAGGTSMVSPPEFHYRGTTLTLPVLRVRSDDAATGETTATVRRDGPLTRVYPTEVATDTDGVGAPYDTENADGSIRQYDNPVRNGTVSVTVHSEYYEGWADYFRSRTTGNVSVDDGNRTATVVLETTGQVGDFPLPEKNDGVAVRGMGSGHSVTDFETSIKKDSGTFNNIWASFYVEEGDRAYEAVVEVPNGIGNSYCDGDEPTSTETLTMDIYYHDSGTAEGVHRWSNDSIPSDSGAVQLACDDGDTVIEVDFTSEEQTFTYGESNIDDETAFDWDERNESATESADPTTFAHGADDDNEPTEYDSGDTQELRILTRHYFALFGTDFDLRVSHGPGDRGTTQIDTSASGGSLQYESASGSTYITYLHVTENNVTVELN